MSVSYLRNHFDVATLSADEAEKYKKKERQVGKQITSDDQKQT